jgi:hypothetical protein
MAFPLKALMTMHGLAKMLQSDNSLSGLYCLSNITAEALQ